jgi:F-type H+-transporting ATPase subunit c
MAASAMESIGRNPNAAGQIFTPMLLGLAFIEALTLYALVIGYLLQAKI